VVTAVTTPTNFQPDLAEIRAFGNTNALAHLGIEILRFDADGAVLTMPVSERTRQPRTVPRRYRIRNSGVESTDP
jgi:hypothetical protein